jgi:CDP-4-dehydro-6-deoxyglucose reductase
MLEHAFHIGFDRPIHLFWGARAQRDLYMDDLPRAWQRDHPQFTYTAALSEPDQSGAPWKGDTGLVNEAVLRAYPQLDAFDIYMSGPPAMIEAAMPQFTAHGARLEHMYSDAFEFAQDVLDKINRNA